MTSPGEALLRWLYSRWSHLPWKLFDGTVGERQPWFVCNEVAFAAIFYLTCAHALTQPAGPQRQLHRLLWCSSVLCGLANELLFAWLPTPDNCWHAQATIMLTPRFPLYLLGACEPCNRFLLLPLPRTLTSSYYMYSHRDVADQALNQGGRDHVDTAFLYIPMASAWRLR